MIQGGARPRIVNESTYEHTARSYHSIQDRQSGAPSACFVAKAPVQALQIHPLSGKAGYCRGGISCPPASDWEGSEQLAIAFIGYEALLQGVLLAQLLPDIAMRRLELVYELPANLHAQADKNRPFISRLTVRSRTDLTKSGAESF